MKGVQRVIEVTSRSWWHHSDGAMQYKLHYGAKALAALSPSQAEDGPEFSDFQIKECKKADGYPADHIKCDVSYVSSLGVMGQRKADHMTFHGRYKPDGWLEMVD